MTILEKHPMKLTFIGIVLVVIAFALLLKQRPETVALTLRNVTESPMESVIIHVPGQPSGRSIDVGVLGPNEQRVIRYAEKGFGVYSLTVRPSGHPAYTTQERLALGGHRITETMGNRDSDWTYDGLSRLYDEDFMYRYSGWLRHPFH